MSQNSSKNLYFHEVHGNDVMIYHDYTTAKRVETSDNGLVFTSRPVKINERISLKLIDVSDKQNAVISIGFTLLNPSTLRHDLAKYNHHNLKNTPGFWICSLSRRTCFKNATLFFYVNQLGQIHYGIDEEENSSFDREIPTNGTPLWACVVIWNSPTTVQLVNSNRNHRTAMTFDWSAKKNVHVDGNKVLKIDKAQNTAYVFTEKPIIIDEYVRVKILDVDQTQRNTLKLGFTSCDPSTLYQVELPDDVDSFLDRTEYWILLSDSSWNFRKNDEISFSLAKSGEMKIWKNNSVILKVIHLDPTLRLWGVFDISTLERIEVRHSLPTILEKNITEPLKGDVKNDNISHVKDQKQGSDDSECKICYENAIEVALYPCGHMSMCFNCGVRQWRSNGQCPLCRERIKDVLKIYKS